MIWHCLINFWMPIELYWNFPRNSLRLVPEEVFIHQALKDKMTPNRTSDNSKRQVGLAAWPTWPLLGKVQHFQYFFSKKSLTSPSRTWSRWGTLQGQIFFQDVSDTGDFTRTGINPSTPKWPVCFFIPMLSIQTWHLSQTHESEIQNPMKNSKIQHPNVMDLDFERKPEIRFEFGYVPGA